MILELAAVVLCIVFWQISLVVLVVFGAICLLAFFAGIIWRAIN